MRKLFILGTAWNIFSFSISKLKCTSSVLTKKRTEVIFYSCFKVNLCDNLNYVYFLVLREEAPY